MRDARDDEGLPRPFPGSASRPAPTATTALLILSAALLGMARPALAEATAGRFVVAADAKTVYDSRTKLTWQRQPPTTGGPANDGRFAWAAAKTWCQNNPAALPGAGWRLPNVQELRSLVDRKAKSASAIDANAFPDTPVNATSAYWSATPVQGGSSVAWGVNFGYGTCYHFIVTDGSRVRCVR